MKHRKIVVFDLDDTLYNEIDYLQSAYMEIASKICSEINSNKTKLYDEMLANYKNGKNVFQELIDKYRISYNFHELLQFYRNHKPNIQISEDRIDLLSKLKENNIEMGLLTDGRSIQQRNKIKALGLENYMSEIVISEEFGSEKPNLKNYEYFESRFGEAQYYYISDNIKKDFISPNKLGWITIRVFDNGLNIHKANDEDFDGAFHAKHSIYSFKELPSLLDI